MKNFAVFCGICKISRFFAVTGKFRDSAHTAISFVSGVRSVEISVELIVIVCVSVGIMIREIKAPAIKSIHEASKTQAASFPSLATAGGHAAEIRNITGIRKYYGI